MLRRFRKEVGAVNAVIRYGRFLLLAAVLLRVDWAMAGDDRIFQDGFDPPPAIHVQTPQIVVNAGEAQTFCYYFRAPNTATVGIRRWASSMDAGMHHLILFATYDGSWLPAERQPAGTLTQTPCGVSEGGGFAAWLYAAHYPAQQLVFPTDDGAGKPLAVEIAPDQPMFVQIYVINTTTNPLSTSAIIDGEALGAAVAYTKSATYLTTNVSFSIPAGATSFPVEQTCTVPAGAKFWWLSTRTHRHAVSSKIRNSGSDVLLSSDWGHPTEYLPMPPNYFQFSAGGMTYQCVYDNPGVAPISSGESEANEEACVGIGYFFPATRPALCINNIGPL